MITFFLRYLGSTTHRSSFWYIFIYLIMIEFITPNVGMLHFYITQPLMVFRRQPRHNCLVNNKIQKNGGCQNLTIHFLLNHYCRYLRNLPTTIVKYRFSFICNKRCEHFISIFGVNASYKLIII